MTLYRLIFTLILSPLLAFASEESFILIDANSQEIITEIGPHIDQRMSPCSTFKVALSLMGFDSGVLIDTQTPSWRFEEGYDDFLESWKEPQTPRSWMKRSCVWFSKLLAQKLGFEQFQHYLNLLDYGNCDASGGLTKAWLSSSLQTSPKEQALFLQRMLNGNLPISSHAIEMTKEILFLEELPNGYKLFGKTGWNGAELGWVIGWIEKEETCLPFAYTLIDANINLAKRLPNAKELLTSHLQAVGTEQVVSLHSADR